MKLKIHFEKGFKTHRVPATYKRRILCESRGKECCIKITTRAHYTGTGTGTGMYTRDINPDIIQKKKEKARKDEMSYIAFIHCMHSAAVFRVPIKDANPPYTHHQILYGIIPPR